MIQKELRKLAAVDADLKQKTSIIAAKLVRLETERTVIKNKINSLNIFSPISGNVTDMADGLADMQWIGDGQRLLAIKGSSSFIITSYISEEDIGRIHKDGLCQFSLLNKFQSINCKIENIAQSAESILEDEMLASMFGGDISAKHVDDYLVPNTAVYKITARINEQNFNITRKALGILKLEADKKNIIERFWHWALGVIIRESGM